MVEETSQISPVEPEPSAETAATAGASGDAASPWQTNGVIPEPTFKPDADADAAAAKASEDTPAAKAKDAAAAMDVPAADDGTLFLSNLAKAMKDAAIAERARLTADTDQRRDAHLASINARRESEAGRIKELAAEDRKGIEAWVADEQKRIEAERVRRTTALETDLETSLAEHGTKIDREIERVEAAITVYRSDVDAYFQRLEGDDDPVQIAQQAGRRPAFPDLDTIGKGVTEAAESAEAKSAATGIGGGGAGATAIGSDVADAASASVDGSATPTAAATAGATPSASLIGVMESGKPQTKLAQAWAAWNESTKAADAVGATKPADDATTTIAGSTTPSATATTTTTAVAEPPATPAPTPITSSGAPSSGEGNIDVLAATAAPVAAGTWKPPTAGVAESPAATSSGGALGWLRRDRDRDHGGR
jgi:hypothetical protein